VGQSRYLAYVAQSSGQQAIYLRPVDQFEAKPVPGTENGVAPFFSPAEIGLDSLQMAN